MDRDTCSEPRWPGGWIRPKPTRSMHRIATDIAAREGLTLDDLRQPVRAVHIVQSRQEAMALMHTEGFSHSQIVRFFGFRNHTTSLHASRVFARRQAAMERAA